MSTVPTEEVVRHVGRGEPGTAVRREVPRMKQRIASSVVVPLLFHGSVDSGRQTRLDATCSSIGFTDRRTQRAELTAGRLLARIRAEFSAKANLWQYMPLREAV
jgi:hypothetical protein